MGLMRSVGGWGIIILGAFFMLIGYILTQMPKAEISSRPVSEIGSNFNQLGFALVAAGFLAWFFLSVWKRNYR